MRNLLIITSIIFLGSCSLPAKQADINRLSELVRADDVSKVVLMNNETVEIYLTKKNMAMGPHLQIEIHDKDHHIQITDSLVFWGRTLELDFQFEISE
jgi:hypothetical protein